MAKDLLAGWVGGWICKRWEAVVELRDSILTSDTGVYTLRNDSIGSSYGAIYNRVNVQAVWRSSAVILWMGLIFALSAIRIKS